MTLVNMAKPAHVRMRGDSWDLKPSTAALLEEKGVIARDYDCEQNTRDNGFPDEGPCYGVVSDGEDGDEERWNASLLDKWEDG